MFNTAKDISIAAFALNETGTYQEQYIRPFHTTVGHEQVNALRESTQDGSSIGISAVERVAGGILTPDSMVEGDAGIANGWRSRRFRFFMRVIEKPKINTGTTVQRVFFGYTDQCDASLNYLDPNMRIYFNSETAVQSFERPLLQGGSTIDTIVLGSNQIISPMDMSQGPGMNNPMTMQRTMHLIRPDDVFSVAGAQHSMQSLVSSGTVQGPITEVYDWTGMSNKGNLYHTSRRKDTSPSRYLAQTLKGYQHALKEAVEEGQVDNRDWLYHEARDHIANSSLNAMDFFAILKEEAGYMEQGYVTYGDLCQIFPQLDQVTVASFNGTQELRRLNDAGSSEHWRGSNSLTIAATALAQIVPSIMMDEFIRTVSFTAQNGRHGMEYAITIDPGNTASIVDNLNMVPHYEEFKRRLAVDILNSITHGGQVGFSIGMTSDLAGESVIEIALGNERARFVAPTFSDSLFSPVVTTDMERRKKIGSDLEWLLSETIPTPNQPQEFFNTPMYQSNVYRDDSTVESFFDQPTHSGNNDDYSGLL